MNIIKRLLDRNNPYYEMKCERCGNEWGQLKSTTLALWPPKIEYNWYLEEYTKACFKCPTCGLTTCYMCARSNLPTPPINRGRWPHTIMAVFCPRDGTPMELKMP
jgi:hypothetical protein